MVSALLLGVGAGVGLWAVAVWLFPPAPGLAAVLARTNPATPPTPQAPETDTKGWATRIGRMFVGPLAALGLPGHRVTADLAVTGRSISQHLAEKAALAVLGFLLPGLIGVALTLVGLGLGVEVPLIGGLASAAAGFVAPDLRARRRAATLRAEFTHALSAYLDLVWITLAGGAGIDSAIHDAVGIGHGWAFTRIRRALEHARLTRTTPWTRLQDLGTELGIAELSELAASASLAGSEGSRIRASLAAKATALRTHQITDAEAAAQAATERMSLPVVVMLLGFLIFIAFPAITQALNGL